MFSEKLKVSVKNHFLFLFCVCANTLSYSQQMVLKSQNVGNKILSSKSTILTKTSSLPTTNTIIEEGNNAKLEEESEVVIVNKTAPSGVDINFLPLFGRYTKTEAQQLDDYMFLSDCDKSFKSRSEASDFFSKMGWDYLSEGDKNTAINRFNLSWLLNPENIDPYWGLGVIEYQSSNFSNAIKLMTKGIDISKNTNYVLKVDLATVYIKMAFDNPNSMIETNIARGLVNDALEIQPKYTPAYMQLTLLNIFENKPDEAWESFHKGYELNSQEINLEILNELLQRKDDPKGIFKK
ncbi:tetratricopeptide repeat protein [Lacihabitans sp. LS3-19]|nr:tetratricopeptide repeat protein [Lacihabitans sp. LS3-19]